MMKQIYLIILFCLLAGMGCRHNQPEKPVKKILILHSFHKDDKYWQTSMIKATEDCFREHKIPVNFKHYYMDFERYDFETMVQSMDSLLNTQRDNRPDLILVHYEPAFYTLLTTRHEFTKTVPIVFCGSHYSIWGVEKHTNITGCCSPIDYESAFKLSHKMFPDINQIRMFMTDRDITQDAERQFKNMSSSIMQGVDPFYLKKGVKNILLNLKKETAIDSTSYVGIVPYWDSFYSRMTRVSDYPFLLVSSIGLGEGSLGGYIADCYEEAYSAAEMGCRILTEGISPDKIPIEPTIKRYIFDWEVMQRLHIQTSQLPDDSRVINMPFSIQYKMHITTGIILIVLILLALFIYYRIQSNEKKQAQLKIKQSKDYLNTIITSIREGVISIDSQMNIFGINQAALNQMHLYNKKEEFEGRNILSLLTIVGTDSKRTLESSLSRIFTQGHESISGYGDLLICLDNQYACNVFSEISSILYEGELFGAVITFRDITEELLQQEYMNLVTRNSDIVIWQFNPKTRELLTNYPFTPDAIPEKNGVYRLPGEELGKLIHPDDIQVWKDDVFNALAHKGIQEEQQFRILKNGQYKWWKCRFTTLDTSATDSACLLFGVFINIQSHKEMEEKLENARLKAERSDSLKSAFLANMSHEIRTPLNGIVGFANLLCNREDYDPDEVSLFIHTIQKNCDLMLALISDIIDLSCIESNTIIYHFADCDVNELISQIVTTQRVIIPEHLELIKQIPEETTTLYIDKLRLNQVITNLINNAVKFTEQGSITIGYTADSPDYLVFFVEDTGRGIPKEDLNKIFERYFKKDNYVQGAGLGLSICRMFVDRFGGEITVQSEVGAGTRFEVKIPRTSAPVN